jgi:hypothetical protein
MIRRSAQSAAGSSVLVRERPSAVPSAVDMAPPSARRSAARQAL